MKTAIASGALLVLLSACEDPGARTETDPNTSSRGLDGLCQTVGGGDCVDDVRIYEVCTR
jgi:hypothetical protein